jgi:hypothetical protein
MLDLYRRLIPTPRENIFTTLLKTLTTLLTTLIMMLQIQEAFELPASDTEAALL